MEIRWKVGSLGLPLMMAAAAAATAAPVAAEAQLQVAIFSSSSFADASAESKNSEGNFTNQLGNWSLFRLSLKCVELGRSTSCRP